MPGCRDGLTLNRSNGRVIALWPRTAVLVTPTCREWADILDEYVEAEPWTPIAAQLVVDVLRSIGHPGPATWQMWPSWVFDSALLMRLLGHWGRWPLSPFPDPTDDPAPPPERFEHLSRGTAALVSVYRACRPYISPAEVDQLTLAQLGALLDSEDVPDEDRPPAPDVRGKYHTLVRNPLGPNGVGYERWERPAGAPLLYQHAKPMKMPDFGLRSALPTQSPEPA